MVRAPPRIAAQASWLPGSVVLTSDPLVKILSERKDDRLDDCDMVVGQRSLRHPAGEPLRHGLLRLRRHRRVIANTLCTPSGSAGSWKRTGERGTRGLPGSCPDALGSYGSQSRRDCTAFDGPTHARDATLPARTRIRTSRNWSGSSRCGVWAELSNQTNCSLGESSAMAYRSAASPGATSSRRPCLRPGPNGWRDRAQTAGPLRRPVLVRTSDGARMGSCARMSHR